MLPARSPLCARVHLAGQRTDSPVACLPLKNPYGTVRARASGCETPAGATRAAVLIAAFVAAAAGGGRGSAAGLRPGGGRGRGMVAAAAPGSEPGLVAEREEGAAARFEQRKTQKMEAISCGADKSKKGSFDAPIADMLEHLNLHADYVSTSSCSGRIAVFWENTAPDAAACGPGDPALVPGEDGPAEGAGGARRHKKGGLGGQWLLCRHGTVSAEDVRSALALAPQGAGVATFKHEPFILHVECCSLDAAARLMEVARNGGFRESGISIGKKHVMVGVRTSALKIEAPVLENGRLIVDAAYVDVLVRLANEKFRKNQERTDRLHALLRRSLLASIPPPHGAPEPAAAAPAAQAPASALARAAEEPGSTGSLSQGPLTAMCATGACAAQARGGGRWRRPRGQDGGAPARARRGRGALLSAATGRVQQICPPGLAGAPERLAGWRRGLVACQPPLVAGRAKGSSGRATGSRTTATGAARQAAE